MQINIKATKMELTPAIEVKIREKVEGLKKYFNNIIEVDVEVGITSSHHQKGDIFRAEMNAAVPKAVLRAEAETDDLYKSITEVKDKLRNELVRYKEKLQD